MPIDAAEEQNPLCEVLQIVGAKWGFAVIAELLKGTLRFNELQRAIRSINKQSLTDTLRLLEQNGVVRREVIPTVPVTVEYSLTEKGRDLHTVIEAMNLWAAKWAIRQRSVVNKS
jgi:DNA-binding HxlR family transcriptional regulator